MYVRSYNAVSMSRHSGAKTKTKTEIIEHFSTFIFYGFIQYGAFEGPTDLKRPLEKIIIIYWLIG